MTHQVKRYNSVSALFFFFFEKNLTWGVDIREGESWFCVSTQGDGALRFTLSRLAQLHDLIGVRAHVQHPAYILTHLCNKTESELQD